MALEVEFFCPLGSTCEEAKDGVIRRCAWYTKMVGLDPNTGESVDDWACSMAWMPMLQVETSKTNRGRTEALDNLRDAAIKGQEEYKKMELEKSNLSGDK